MTADNQNSRAADEADAGAGLEKILFALGRDADGKTCDTDLDIAAFLLGDNGKVGAQADIIFYGNPGHQGGTLRCSGNSRTGSDPGATADADNTAEIIVELSKMPHNVSRVVFTVSIYEFDKRRQNFGKAGSSFVRVADMVTGQELIRYELAEDFSIETAVVAGELYRHGAVWKFDAAGVGVSGGLAALCSRFGVDAEA